MRPLNVVLSRLMAAHDPYAPFPSNPRPRRLEVADDLPSWFVDRLRRAGADDRGVEFLRVQWTSTTETERGTLLAEMRKFTDADVNETVQALARLDDDGFEQSLDAALADAVSTEQHAVTGTVEADDAASVPTGARDVIEWLHVDDSLVAHQRAEDALAAELRRDTIRPSVRRAVEKILGDDHVKRTIEHAGG